MGILRALPSNIKKRENDDFGGRIFNRNIFKDRKEKSLDFFASRIFCGREDDYREHIVAKGRFNRWLSVKLKNARG